MRDLNETRIAVLGLGYVGLLLAVEFAKHFEVIGFDIKEQRVSELEQGYDRTLEVEDDVLNSAVQSRLSVTTTQEDLVAANVYIVTTPTPIDEDKKSDLRPITAASASIGAV